MKRRVAVARLLANDADYLLMDEPFESLDYQTRLRMQQFLISIHETFSKSILLVTHQVDEAILLSDRVLLMSNKPGRIAQDLEIKLDRPRDSRSDRFNEYRAMITSHLDREVESMFGSESMQVQTMPKSQASS
jgi:ABC-type nitrate/sulfonate/bicarbonate transport system ATPase subunit